MRRERELCETNYITHILYNACKCQAVWFSVAIVLLSVFVGVSYVTCIAPKNRRKNLALVYFAVRIKGLETCVTFVLLFHCYKW